MHDDPTALAAVMHRDVLPRVYLALAHLRLAVVSWCLVSSRRWDQVKAQEQQVICTRLYPPPLACGRLSADRGRVRRKPAWRRPGRVRGAFPPVTWGNDSPCRPNGTPGAHEETSAQVKRGTWGARGGPFGIGSGWVWGAWGAVRGALVGVLSAGFRGRACLGIVRK